ncbi:FCD domain-containing protein [Jannaschia rubra]|uniref:HTH-type transcriptional repressor YvoA n=1 Tax=Jannaschia rubra TaxID=282197 RepID=A0A0M6XTN6_9RHOB|nr:FCD domain-containing protein [Jannaschia rubra]CTQ33545.1 HTH-type transcriptional repressor YvoA [Jannaschia rubra]SFG03574.1 transcriptional regulator, GntR family [Jannaschia rubra]
MTSEIDTDRPTEAADRQRSVSSTIAGVLVEEIRDGTFPEDSPLPTERALCERFGASRPTVREALAQVQMRGFARGGAGRRPRAALPSMDSALRAAAGHVRDVLGDAESGAHLEQMRQFIETGAARTAAARADSLQIAKLRSALAANAEAIGTAEFAATDIAFHRALVAVVGNPVILTLHDMFVSTMIAHRPPTEDAARYDSIAHGEHREIYEAVVARDVLRATDVMDRHLERSWRARLAAPRGPEKNDRSTGG